MISHNEILENINKLRDTSKTVTSTFRIACKVLYNVYSTPDTYEFFQPRQTDFRSILYGCNELVRKTL